MPCHVNSHVVYDTRDWGRTRYAAEGRLDPGSLIGIDALIVDDQMPRLGARARLLRQVEYLLVFVLLLAPSRSSLGAHESL
jgi:hypothetical protein